MSDSESDDGELEPFFSFSRMEGDAAGLLERTNASCACLCGTRFALGTETGEVGVFGLGGGVSGAGLLRSHSSAVLDVSLSIDGSVAASGGADGFLCVAGGGERPRQREQGGRVQCVAIDPRWNETRVIAAPLRGDKIELVKVSGGWGGLSFGWSGGGKRGELLHAELSKGALLAMQFSPSGRRLAWVNEASVEVHDLADGRKIAIRDAPGSTTRRPCLSWDGDEKLLVGWGARVTVLHLPIVSLSTPEGPRLQSGTVGIPAEMWLPSDVLGVAAYGDLLALLCAPLEKEAPENKLSGGEAAPENILVGGETAPESIPFGGEEGEDLVVDSSTSVEEYRYPCLRLVTASSQPEEVACEVLPLRGPAIGLASDAARCVVGEEALPLLIVVGAKDCVLVRPSSVAERTEWWESRGRVNRAAQLALASGALGLERTRELTERWLGELVDAGKIEEAARQAATHLASDVTAWETLIRRAARVDPAWPKHVLPFLPRPAEAEVWQASDGLVGAVLAPPRIGRRPNLRLARWVYDAVVEYLLDEDVEALAAATGAWAASTVDPPLFDVAAAADLVQETLQLPESFRPFPKSVKSATLVEVLSSLLCALDEAPRALRLLLEAQTVLREMWPDPSLPAPATTLVRDLRLWSAAERNMSDLLRSDPVHGPSLAAEGYPRLDPESVVETLDAEKKDDPDVLLRFLSEILARRDAASDPKLAPLHDRYIALLAEHDTAGLLPFLRRSKFYDAASALSVCQAQVEHHQKTTSSKTLLFSGETPPSPSPSSSSSSLKKSIPEKHLHSDLLPERSTTHLEPSPSSQEVESESALRYEMLVRSVVHLLGAVHGKKGVGRGALLLLHELGDARGAAALVAAQGSRAEWNMLVDECTKMPRLLPALLEASPGADVAVARVVESLPSSATASDLGKPLHSALIRQQGLLRTTEAAAAVMATDATALYDDVWSFRRRAIRMGDVSALDLAQAAVRGGAPESLLEETRHANQSVLFPAAASLSNTYFVADPDDLLSQRLPPATRPLLIFWGPRGLAKARGAVLARQVQPIAPTVRTVVRRRSGSVASVSSATSSASRAGLISASPSNQSSRVVLGAGGNDAQAQQQAVEASLHDWDSGDDRSSRHSDEAARPKRERSLSSVSSLDPDDQDPKTPKKRRAKPAPVGRADVDHSTQALLEKWQGRVVDALQGRNTAQDDTPLIYVANEAREARIAKTIEQ